MITFETLLENINLKKDPEVMYEIFTPELFIRHSTGEVSIVTEGDSKILNGIYNSLPSSNRDMFLKKIRSSKNNYKKYISR